MANMNALQQKIFPDENAPIHGKKSVTAASVKTKGSVLGQKKPVGARKALGDLTNTSRIHQKASAKTKQIAACSGKDEINIAEERFLHDHNKCIKEQQKHLWDWDDHFSADLIQFHHNSSIKEKHLSNNIEKMDAMIDLTYNEPEEIPSPKLSSTPWQSPIRHGSITESTPLDWKFESIEFKLKEDCGDLF